MSWQILQCVYLGFQLLQALRNDERTRTIPVILLSARAGEESRVEGLDAGATPRGSRRRISPGRRTADPAEPASH